jgi:nucleoside-diphosphate-sugar epimerase
VVVTGADQPLGRAVVAALLAAGAAEVRATVRDRSAARSLVERGVRTAVSDLVDPLRLGAVIEGAHTVIHLDGAEPVAGWDLLLDAADGTGVRRLVTVCGPGADLPPASEEYQVVVVRTAFPAAGSGPDSGPDSGPPAALVRALVEADRRRQAGTLEVVDLPP